MADEYIEKSTVLDIICKYWRSKMYADDAIQAALDEIGYHVPAADVQPVRHGRWEKNDDGIMVWWECSECHRNAWYDGDNLFDYCPDCGAKMDGGET